MKTDEGNKKTVLRTVLIISGCVITGFGLGFMSGYFDISFGNLFGTVKDYLAYIIPPVFYALAIFQIAFTVIAYNKSKKIYASWDGDDNEHIEKAELIIDVTNGLLSVCYIILILFISVWSYISTNLMSDEQFDKTLLLSLSMYFSVIGTGVFTILMQRACIQLIKRINPEKRGEIMSLNFGKVWEQSLDEAQKLMTFEVGYRTYQFINKAFIIAWLICLIGMDNGMGLAPVVTVSLLWLVSTVAHIVYGYKIEYKDKSKNK